MARLAYEDIDKRIWVTQEADDDNPQVEETEWQRANASVVLSEGVEAVGEDRANDILVNLPILRAAIDYQNWQQARRMLDVGLQRDILTQTEHDAFTAILDSYGV